MESLSSKKKQANFFISHNVLISLRTFIPYGQQSEFVEKAIEQELKRQRFQKALDESAGTWKAKDHPKKTGAFIRSLRESKRP